MGLARGFQYAGARSLVASLWPIEDAAAAGFMSRFYAGIAAGHGPLACAMRDRIAAGRLPQEWAPFFLSGRSRTEFSMNQVDALPAMGSCGGVDARARMRGRRAGGTGSRSGSGHHRSRSGPGPPGSGSRHRGGQRRHGTTTLAVESQRVYLLEVPEGTDIDEALTDLGRIPASPAPRPTESCRSPKLRAGARWPSPILAPACRSRGSAGDRTHPRVRRMDAESRRGVIVAVLDTGIDAGHPQLSGRIAAGAVDLVDGDNDPSDLPDEVNSDEDDLVDEAVGHGTFVAGLVLTVAPDARVLPIRILDSDGMGSAIDIARGVEIAVESGARVVNLSFGMEVESEVLQEVIAEQIRDKGIVFISSAGNEDSDRPQYPAGQNEVVGVAATTPGDARPTSPTGARGYPSRRPASGS